MELIDKFRRDLDQWKKQYKYLYLLEFNNGEFFIFKLISKRDYKVIIEHGDFQDNIDHLIQECIIYPELTQEYIDGLLAGTVLTLYEKILYYSGFSDINYVEELYKINQYKFANILDDQISYYICKAFPKLSLDEVDNMLTPDLMRNLACAEKILGVEIKISDKPAKQKMGRGFDPTGFINTREANKRLDKANSPNVAPPGDYNLRRNR